ncbi:conditioned medium-induced protein 4 [Halovenus salina]|uniref:Conditioned medium-induced protein 4 n=1 Tax=Halovenus salina TaxID=1510225 RepID=A0ABD5W116_9EURY|nr:conditioned medium-induced protein 4 [Halovenus salina]
MDEKTEELRDIFLDVSEEEAVTESQEELRGSVADSGKVDRERLTGAIEELEEKFDIETDCSTEQRQTLVERFYEGADDETLAAELSVPTATVFETRMSLHLVRDDDPPAVTASEETWELLRERADADPETLAAEFDLTATEIERILAVVQANARSRRVSHRFRTTFEECLTDIELSTQLAADAQRDGLDEATEDAEVDVEF